MRVIFTETKSKVLEKLTLSDNVDHITKFSMYITIN